MRRTALLLLPLLLAACAGGEDGAYGTLTVPNARTDCQVRETNVAVDGGGPFISSNMNSRITTIIGPANCPPGMQISIPARQTVVIPPTPAQPATPPTLRSEPVPDIEAPPPAAGFPELTPEQLNRLIERLQ